jgi:hypothetical protein
MELKLVGFPLQDACYVDYDVEARSKISVRIYLRSDSLVCSFLTLPCYVQYAQNHLISVESSSFYVCSL